MIHVAYDGGEVCITNVSAVTRLEAAVPRVGNMTIIE
jgi:hypothetical protein